MKPTIEELRARIAAALPEAHLEVFDDSALRPSLAEGEAMTDKGGIE